MRPEDDIHDWQALATEQALQLKLERVRRKRAEETLARIKAILTRLPPLTLVQDDLEILDLIEEYEEGK